MRRWRGRAWCAAAAAISACSFRSWTLIARSNAGRPGGFVLDTVGGVIRHRRPMALCAALLLLNSCLVPCPPPPPPLAVLTPLLMVRLFGPRPNRVSRLARVPCPVLRAFLYGVLSELINPAHLLGHLRSGLTRTVAIVLTRLRLL